MANPPENSVEPRQRQPNARVLRLRGQRGLTPGAAQARAVADLLIALGGNGSQLAADARSAILPLDALPEQPEHLTK